MGGVSVGCRLAVYTLGTSHVPVAELTLLSLTALVLPPLWVWVAIGEVPSGYTLAGVLASRRLLARGGPAAPAAADRASSERS